MTQQLQISLPPELAETLDDIQAQLRALSQRLDPPKEWLTVKEAAEALNCKPATIRKRVRDGLLQSRRDGGKNILIHRSEVTQAD